MMNIKKFVLFSCVQNEYNYRFYKTQNEHFNERAQYIIKSNSLPQVEGWKSNEIECNLM